MVHRTMLMRWWMYRMWVKLLTLGLITKCCMGFHRRWPWVVALILPKFLTSLPSGIKSLQFVSADFVPPNLLVFAEWCLLWCPISTGSECQFCAIKSVWLCWATSALVSHFYRQWVLVLCQQICFILLSNICFGVWSLQEVSVGFVPPNLYDFTKQHLLWCPISAGSECWFCATKSVWLCWATSTLVSDLYRQWVLILCHHTCFILLSTSAFVSDLYRKWVLILCHQICLILLSDICFGAWSLQQVSVDFVPTNLFHFAEQHLLWCLIPTASECWFCATKSVSFCWATSAFDIYRQWVLILCHQICFILLSNICFGVWYSLWVLILCHQLSLILLSNIYVCSWYIQEVSVDFVLPNLFDFAEQHLLLCLTSTDSEYWFCATKSVWFCWATSTFMPDLYSEWVLILCHQICFIFLSNICFDVWPLQEVSVDLYHQICLILLSNICFGVWSLQAVSVDFCHQICFILLSGIYFGVWSLQQVSADFVPWFCATKFVLSCWVTSALVSDLYSEWVLILLSDICSNVYSLWVLLLCHHNLFDFSEQHLLWCLISTASKCWFCVTKYVSFCWVTSALVSDFYRQWVLILCHQICFNFLSKICSDLYRKWVLILCHQICLILLSNICLGVWSLQKVSVDLVSPNLFDFAEWHLLWCLISTASECWFCAIKYFWFFWVTSAFLSNLYSLWVLILCHQICLIFPTLVVSDLYRQWVLILCSQICFILLSDICLLSDLYRQWVLILCHQICFIFLSGICFGGVWSLQFVSVDFVPPICLILLSDIYFGVWSLQAVSVDFCATKSVTFCWPTSALVSNFYSLWVLILCQQICLTLISTASECCFVSSDLYDFTEQHLLWCLISTVCGCWFLCHQICLILLSDICFGIWSLQEVSVNLVPPNLFDFSEWHLLWCPISTGSECWFWKSIWFCWAMSILVSNLYRQWVWIVLVVFSTTFLVSYHICRWYVACIVVIHCLAHYYECFSLIVLILLVFSLWVCNWT